MGRPPCCDKVGIKKGPWTPEEDIILVSYIQEHGPGNWRSVPTNTGLLRCSKSCRLRWTNYLRPGIKRGNFTPHEEGMIIHLQALLGNKWAAIASYLPQRTDNDIKNYWNTHLKKKLKKLQSALENNEKTGLDHFAGQSSSARNLNNQSSTYASSTENISRLLEGWMRSSPKTNSGIFGDQKSKPKQEEVCNSDHFGSDEGFDSILSFAKTNSVSWIEDQNKFAGESSEKGLDQISTNGYENKEKGEDDQIGPPLTFIEKWLLDEASGGQVEEMSQLMELSSIF